MFKSSSSKAQSLRLINKLTGSISKDDTSKKSSTELLNDQLKPKTKKVIKKQNKVLQKKSLQNTKELKRVKYELIKSKKDDENLSTEHKKYLNKLVRKNKHLVLKNNELDDEFDTQALQEEILKFNSKPTKKKTQFKTKIKHNHPGLTPGLAPVDYDESDDE